MANKLQPSTIALDDESFKIPILDMRPTHILRAQAVLMIYDQKWWTVFPGVIEHLLRICV
jgi:hypothetical protein